MRAQMPVAILTIVLGALETAAGVQELVVQGIAGNRTYPLTAGTLGAVSGALLVATAIAILTGSQLAGVLARSTACVSIPVFVLIGVVTHIAGWPMTAVGIILPIVLILFTRKAAALQPVT